MPLPELHFPEGKTVVEVPFEVERNLMVIPLSINGSRPLRFILDTGAQGTFLQNMQIADSLNLKIAGKVGVRGAGGGGARREASLAENVAFNIGGIELRNGGLAVFPSPLGPQAMASHDGAIGRVVFATLVVEVDWEKKVIRFYEPSKYKYTGSGTILPLTFDEGGRPYTTASVAITEERSIPVKLVVDTGASHALSLDVGSNPEIKVPEGAAKVVLGRGASGEVTGFRHVGQQWTAGKSGRGRAAPLQNDLRLLAQAYDRRAEQILQRTVRRSLQHPDCSDCFARHAARLHRPLRRAHNLF